MRQYLPPAQLALGALNNFFMFNKISHFIKYNNATVFVVLFIFIFGSGVFAAESGVLGEKQIKTEGIDNTLLLSADFNNFDMDFKVGEIKEDDENYYVAYTYIDFVLEDSAWQYLMKQKTKKVSKKLKIDLGVYLAEEFAEEHGQRIKDLKKEQKNALDNGKGTRIEVVEYSGLLGKALDLASKTFPGYQPTGRRAVASPVVLPVETKNYEKNSSEQNTGQIQSDNLVDVYNNYIQNHINELIISADIVSIEDIASTTEEVVSNASSSQSIVLPEQPIFSEPDVVVIDLVLPETITEESPATETAN